MCENMSIVFKTKGIDVTGSLINNNMLSAYKNSLCSLAPPITPLIPESALIAVTKGSKNRLKRNGERGLLCWVPLDRLKKEEIILFVRTAALGLENNTLTHLIKGQSQTFQGYMSKNSTPPY